MPPAGWLDRTRSHIADLQAKAAAENLLLALSGKPPAPRFKVKLIGTVDTLDRGILVYSDEKRVLMPPPCRPGMTAMLDRGWVRGITLVAAFTLMLLVTLFPRPLTVEDGSPIGHGTLMLIMWGLSAGFVHGIGFVPRNSVLRVVLGPVIAWLLMGVGIVFYIRYFFR